MHIPTTIKSFWDLLLNSLIQKVEGLPLSLALTNSLGESYVQCSLKTSELNSRPHEERGSMASAITYIHSIGPSLPSTWYSA